MKSCNWKTVRLFAPVSNITSTFCQIFAGSQKTLRRMITNCMIKAKRIGGSIRIPHSELNKIIKEY